VTGANKGIGFETVRLLAQQQPESTILLGARSQANADTALAKLTTLGLKNVRTLLIDIDSEQSVSAAVAEVKKKFGRLNVLIDNAAILSDDAASVIHTNVVRTAAVDAAFLPLIPTDGTGRIIIVSSVVSSWVHHHTPANTRAIIERSTLTVEEVLELAKQYVASKGPASAGAERFNKQIPGTFHGGPYGASKLLVSAYGRALGRDLAPQQIPVILVCPGYCSTDMTGHGAGSRPAEAGAQSIVAGLTKGKEDVGKLFQDSNHLPDVAKVPQGFPGADE
jgi:NAD(P)-dependent dehydrogenase (short-subunit alcohol dehydrogenase family)